MASDDTSTYDSIVDVHLYTGCLSFVGGFLVLGMFWWDKRLRQEQLGKMVQIITICDLLYTVKFVAGAVSWHMGLRDERDSFHIFPDNCLSSAVYGMLLSTAIVAWNACWLVDLVITITRPLSSTRKHMVWYHIFVWSASVGTAVYVWATGVPAQSADHTCWVRADSANLVLFDFIVGLYLVLAVGSLLFALRATLFAGTRMTRSLRAAIFWRHFTYVATFAFMWAWPFVHHFLEDTMWVTYVDAFTVSGQAFALSLIRLREPGAAAAMVEMLGALGRDRQSFAAGLAPPASPMAAATGEKDAPGWGPSLGGVSLPEIEFGKALGSSQAPSLRGRARGQRQARSQAGRGTGDEADSSDDSSDWASLGAPERVNWPGLSGEASSVALLSAAAASEAGADGDGSEGGQDADEIDAAAELAAGFDVGATLRRELSLCVLSGLCQTVLVAELDYGLAKDAAARRGPAHKEAPCVSLALGDSALSSGGRLASGQSFGPGSTTSIGKESAGPSSAAAQGAAPASGAGGASGWWGTESLGRAGDGSAVIPGPLPPPEKVESFAELLKRPATARRRFSMLSNFSSKKFQRAARKVAHAAAVKAAEDDALLAASSSGRFRSRRRQKRRRALSTRYKPPLGSLVSMTLNGSMAGAGRAAGVPILVEGEDSTTSGEDSERGARRSLGRRGSRSHKSHTAKASRAGRAGETGTLQHPGRGRGSGSPAAAAPGGLGQRSDSTDSSMHLDEPLLLGAGADGRGSFSRQSSGSSVDEGGSPLLSSDPPRVRVFTAAPRRSDRRRSSVMDEFQVQSIEDEAFAKLRARMGIGGVQLASAFDPALMQEGKLRAHFSHGASRSFFCRSVNDDIILKTIERDEVEALASLLPAYLKHLDVNPDSLLCRFLALIVVHVRGVGPLYCLVMQNSFPFGNLGMQSVVFDLKGSTVGRRSKPAGDDSHGAKKGKAKPKGALRLDQDFREMAPKGVPLASPRLTSEIVSQVIRDVTLLGTYGLMDYSCLLAISPVPDGCRAQVQSAGPAPLNAGGPPRRWSSFSAVVSEIPEWRPDPSVPARKSVQVVVQIGIVDLLQQYDLGKKIEHRFKQLMRLGRSADVSAVPAERYASRFSDFVANVLQGCDIALKPAKGPTG
ncbi:hypothetical protein FNF27_00554 [Cafeteria roenbergensis]|uniref:PIPK domain-containing protein n=1 Tax=Cafeteria roenbergensis TaxID=33653 RepID=A0A5A8EJD0_CAFRO|nr:hypothetical protein FNF27_00554 [Cafeteria roenbergensis]